MCENSKINGQFEKLNIENGEKVMDVWSNGCRNQMQGWFQGMIRSAINKSLSREEVSKHGKVIIKPYF